MSSCHPSSASNPRRRRAGALRLGDRIRLRELTEIPDDIHQLLVEHLGAPDPVVQLQAALSSRARGYPRNLRAGLSN